MSKLFELPGQTTLSRVVAVYEDKDHQVPEEYASRVSFMSCYLIQRGIIRRSYKKYTRRFVFVSSREEIDELQRDGSVLFIITTNQIFEELLDKSKCITNELILAQFSKLFQAEGTPETLIILLSTLLQITDMIAPWDVSMITLLNMFPNLHQFSNDTFTEFFPKTYWITNFMKLKNYDERRLCLSNMTNMIQTPINASKVDEIILLGEKSFVNEERFRYDSLIHTPTRFIEHSKYVLWPVKNIVEWTQENLESGSVVIIARPDTYLSSVNGQVFNFSKVERGRLYTLNAVIVPDIPDPRPELVGRGNPIVAGAVLIRYHNEPISIEEPVLEKVGLYDHQVFCALSYEFMRKRYTIGNLSISFNIFQVKPTQTFSGNESEKVNRVIRKENSVIMLSNKIHPLVVQDIVFKDFTGRPFFTKENLYETITLRNMANKQLSRKNQTYWQIQEDDMRIPSTSVKISNMDGIILTESYLTRLQERFIYDPWKKGVSTTNISLGHPFIGVPPGVLVIPKSSDNPELNTINTFALLIHQVLTGRNLHFFIQLSNTELTEIPVWKECLFSYPGVKIDRVEMKTLNLLGGRDSLIATYPTEQSSVGFIPALVRQANVLAYEAHSKKMDLSTDLFKDIDGDNMVTPESENVSSPQRPIGLILGEEWVSTLDKLCKKYRPDIEWRHYVHGTDIHFNDLANVKYAVGTSTGTAWILSMLLDPKKASVIEIAKEHEYDPKWYHVTSSVGCNHAVLPLKTEPTKQCVDRIKKQLSVYFDELDKALAE